MSKGSSDKRHFSEKNKLWITEDYYCRFDDAGRILAEDTYEGALGYVIKLFSDFPQEHKFAALKIPKLVGSTHRENAYVNELMYQEESTVSNIRRSNASGLLGVIQTQVMRKPLDFQSKESLMEFNQGLFFAKFEAGKPPIILLRRAQGSLYPELENTDHDSARKFIAQVDMKNIRDLTLANGPRGKEFWKKTVFLAKKPSLGESVETDYIPINEFEAAKLNPSEDTWYTCLPSVIYTWAYGTLQEVISAEQDIGKDLWTPQDHLKLALNIASGLEELHRRGYVHADIRPANILFTDDDVNNLRKYTLADYGSLASTPQDGVGSQGGDSGETVLGPVFEGERSSVFYAPERYKGHEREITNRGVVWKNPEGQVTHVVLGWQNSLTKERAQKAVEQTQGVEMDGVPSSESQPLNYRTATYSEARLRAGDRVRIQDYIFQLTDNEQQVGGLFVLPCDGMVSKMSQGHIAVRHDDHNEIPEDLPADRTIEMLQWSAATDIYSLGIMILYTIYRNGYEDPEEKYRNNDVNEAEPVEKADHAKTYLRESEKDLEDSFRRMIIYLSNPQFFELIWRDLESLRQELEDQRGKRDIEFDVAKRVFPTGKYFGNNGSDDKAGNGTDKSLLKQAIDVTNIFTQLVPGARRLCASLEFNLAAFVFILHFALACIHRRKHLITKLDWMDPKYPFCDSRIEPPKDGAAKRVRQRLEELDDIFAQFENDEALKSFKLAERAKTDEKFDLDQTILPLSSDTDFNIRQQKIKLDNDYKTLIGDMKKLNTEKEKLHNTIIEIMNAYEEYENTFIHSVIGKSKIDREILNLIAPYRKKKDEANSDGS